MTEKRSAFVIPYTSIDDIPREEYKNLHRAYWKFIAEEGVLLKPDVVYSNGLKPRKIRARCFACTYVERFSETELCESCPIKIWRREKVSGSVFETPPCCEEDSLFKKWIRTLPGKKSKELALQIANLEWEDI